VTACAASSVSGRVVAERVEAGGDRLRGVERQRDGRGLGQVGRIPAGETIAWRWCGCDLDRDSLEVDALPGQVGQDHTIDGDGAGSAGWWVEGQVCCAVQVEPFDSVLADDVWPAAGEIAQFLHA
jgi:hypothetical protein